MSQGHGSLWDSPGTGEGVPRAAAAAAIPNQLQTPPAPGTAESPLPFPPSPLTLLEPWVSFCSIPARSCCCKVRAGAGRGMTITSRIFSSGTLTQLGNETKTRMLELYNPSLCVNSLICLFMGMRQQNISKVVGEELNYLHQQVLSWTNFL